MRREFGIFERDPHLPCASICVGETNTVHFHCDKICFARQNLIKNANANKQTNQKDTQNKTAMSVSSGPALLEETVKPH